MTGACRNDCESFHMLEDSSPSVQCRALDIKAYACDVPLTDVKLAAHVTISAATGQAMKRLLS